MATNPLQVDIESDQDACEDEQWIFDVLCIYLPADSTMTPQEAAQKMHNLLPENQPDTGEKKFTEGWLCQFWDLMWRVAYQLDYREEPMQRFLALLKALYGLPVTTFTNYRGIQKQVWQDRSYFGIMLSERWDRCGPSPEKPDNRRWKNINGIMAHMSNDGGPQSLHAALCAIHAGLENHDGKSRKQGYLQWKKITVTCHVPTAAVWFILSAPKLYRACQQEECKSSNPEWKGEPSRGYSTARWEYWRSRFVALIDDPDAIEETIESCMTAIDAIDAAGSV